MSKSRLSHWITLIVGRSRRGFHEETIHLFHQMRREGLRPDRYVLPSVLRSCSHLSDWRTGKLLHCFVVRTFLSSDPFIGCALIEMYSRCGQVVNARRLFDRMTEKDLVVWNSMVAGYAHLGLLDDAMDVFVKLQSCGLKPDLVTWNALISGFSQVGNDEMALDFFRSMQRNGLRPDVFSWTSVISGFVRNFSYDKAFGMFKQMVVVARVQPSSVTISSILPACSNVMNLSRGKEIHGYAVVFGLQEDLFVGSSLIDMYAKCGLICEAGKVFTRMRKKNSVSWNSMIFGYSNHGHCDEAIDLFNQMVAEGVKADHLTFTAVFTACSHAGMVELGRNLFKLMQEDHGIEPRLEHYACMVDILGRAGMLLEAYDFIKGMPINPDSFVWGALLGACRNHGNVEFAKLAASELYKLEPDSAGSCLLLSNVLVDAGRWGDAIKTKKLVKKQKLKRYLACSWT